ncbi:MAG: lysylphosphatidylglycerol synthase transmembrane domain-containing protein [bacterium]
MLKRTSLWVGILISVVFLWLAFREVDFARVKEAIKDANYGYFVLALILSMGTTVFRTIRWRYILTPLCALKYHRIFSWICIGYMANNLLPARLGEVLRAYMMGKKEGVSKSATLGTIVVERIFDGLALLFLLLLMPYFFSLPAWAKKAGIFGTAFFISASFVLILFLIKKEAAVELIKGIVSRLLPWIADRVGHLLSAFVLGLEIIYYRKRILAIFVFSILVWIQEALCYYAVAFSFGLDLPFYVPIFTVIMVNLGIMIPASPGYVGTFEFFTILSLGLFQVEKSLAASYSVVVHAAVFIPVTLIGLIYFWREHINFKELEKARKEVKK